MKGEGRVFEGDKGTNRKVDFEKGKAIEEKI